MRSVVVVLPASMCAMIPMLRVFSRGNALGIVSCRSVVDGGCGCRAGSGGAGKKIGPGGPTRGLLIGARPASLCGRVLHVGNRCPPPALADEHAQAARTADHSIPAGALLPAVVGER